MSADPPTNEELLEAARQGDRLERLVSLRLDQRAPMRLQGVFQGMPGGTERVWG
jgi:hypothetical protein